MGVAISPLPARAGGLAVVTKLRDATSVVGLLTSQLKGGGGFGNQGNAAKIPFLGADPTQGLNVFGPLDSALASVLGGFDPLATDTVASLRTKLDTVSASLASALGSTAGLSNYRLACGSSACTDTAAIETITTMRVKLGVSGAIAGDGTAFTFPLDSLPLVPKGAGNLKVDLKWKIAFDVLVDDRGVHLVADEAPGAHELSLTAAVTLETGTIDVDLGVLRMKAAPQGTPGFRGTLTVDFAGENLGSPTFGFEDASVDAVWKLSADTTSPLVGISSDLHVAWALTGQGVSSNGLSITLENIEIDASKLLGTSLKGITDALKPVVDPVYTAVSPLREPLPGFSAVAEKLGFGEVSLLTLAEAGGASTDLRKNIHAIEVVHNGLKFAADGKFPLGTIRLSGPEALKPAPVPDLSQFKNIVDGCGPCRDALGEIQKQLGDLPANLGPDAEAPLKFDFPAFEKPESLAQLLLGHDVKLVTFDTGDQVRFNEDYNIPLIKWWLLSLELEGRVDAGIRLVGGVDTKGIRDLLSTANAGPELLLHGIYLENAGDPIAHASSTMGVRGVVGIEGVLDAGIKVEPNIDIRLVVPPGQPIRPFENIDDLGCLLLKNSGKADFRLRLEAFVETPPLVPDIHHELANAVLLTKEDICDPNAQANAPVLASVEGDNLRLHPGTERGLTPGETDAMSVVAVHDGGAISKIVVRANGNATQTIDPANGIKSVSYDAVGDSRPVNLQILADGKLPFELPVTVRTAGGDDKVAANLAADRTATIELGDGKDTYTGGPGIDKVVAGPGDDTVSGAGGNDDLAGGPGADALTGDDGDDVLRGEADNDSLLGGKGTNRLVGGPGDDQLLSQEGDDLLFGDEDAELAPGDAGATDGGSDFIILGGGADKVIAGNGNDVVLSMPGKTAAPGVSAVRVLGNGGDDEIVTGNGGDTVFGGLGADKISTLDGVDTAYGDAGADRCVQEPTTLTAPAETATIGTGDTINGGPGDDQLSGEAGDDTINGGDGADRLCGHAGDDTLKGDAGTDTAWGGSGADTIDGGDDADLLYGNDGGDRIAGGTGADVVLGQAGDDPDLSGGEGDDRIEGGAGKDAASGDAGNDDILGGSSAAFVPAGVTTAAVGDTGDGPLVGGDGHDVIIGDNGTITRTGQTNPNNGAPVRVVALVDAATVGGSDLIAGDAGDDALFGGLGADRVEGGAGDDHIEGNAAADELYGFGIGGGDPAARDQDDIIGGSSSVNPDAVKADAGETILRGDGDHDVMIGDNGEITRPVDGNGRWTTDPLTGGVSRSVTLADRTTTGAALTVVSGGDFMEGGDGNDRMFGEGGDDYVKGNGGGDLIEGDQGADRLEGNDGSDDLVGGSTLSAGVGVGDVDAGDRLAGGEGADLLIGDNAIVTRSAAAPGASWDSAANTWLGFDVRRSVTLLDTAALNPERFGNDVLSGGSGPDVLFGQDGDDGIYGGAHDDYMEGNGGTDSLFGDQNAAPTGDPRESAAAQLDGPAGPDGQDDQIGGSSLVRSVIAGAVTGYRDSADTIQGDGNADVQLGDNGRLVRTTQAGQYVTRIIETQRPTIVRQATLAGTGAPTALPARYDVGAATSSGVFGSDTLLGGDGDDQQFGQDGNDTMRGGAGDDDMYGELGDDNMNGDAGEDAMLGDRGLITNKFIGSPGATISITGVPKLSFTPYAAHAYDRRVDMNDDGDGLPLQSPGMGVGGNDTMRGGADHDSMHGETGNDIMNGDGGGDYLFGDDGADVMWGGQGRECADPADATCANDRGANDTYVDYLFGGRGLATDPVTGGADLLDFRPRPNIDPAAWFEATNTRASDPTSAHQHHQGIDWMYGGWDRDVMQANVADNGPNDGDRMIDWNGNFNLYTLCPAAYGGYNVIRQHSPSMQSFLEQLAFALGIGRTTAEVSTPGTSAFAELALVRTGDANQNAGAPFPGTPGHFDSFSCAP